MPDRYPTVSWPDATAEQHDARASEQRERAGRLVVDAERHEDAARAIRAAGVSCLRDMEATAALAADWIEDGTDG